jgi:hypothetical protein
MRGNQEKAASRIFQTSIGVGLRNFIKGIKSTIRVPIRKFLDPLGSSVKGTIDRIQFL